MIFKTNPIPQSVSIPFNWCADYYDETYLSEYNFNNQNSNSFYDIKQNETMRFGLFGQNMKFFFEVSDGSFMLNGRRIDIGYEVDGKLHILTNNPSKKDFITYKEASATFNGVSGIQKSNIDSFNFGYKTIYEKDDLLLNFQSVVSLPVGDTIFIDTKLSSKSDLNGHIIFFNKNKEVERFHAPLDKNTSGQIRWTVK